MAISVLDIIKETNYWEVVKVDAKDLRLRCRVAGSKSTPWIPFQDEVWEFLPENMEFLVVGGMTRLPIVP